MILLQNVATFRAALHQHNDCGDKVVRDTIARFTTPSKILCLLFTDSTNAHFHSFRKSGMFKAQMARLSGRKDASLVCMGDPNSPTSLKGLPIRFTSRATATEVHATLLELLPGRTWPKFTIGYETAALYRLNSDNRVDIDK